jgi:hypothetical protein
MKTYFQLILKSAIFILTALLLTLSGFGTKANQ